MEQTTDRRRRAPDPVPARPDDVADLITREEAAVVIGCTPRTVTRYAAQRRITKYTDRLGRVRFSRRQCTALSTFSGG